MQPGRMVWREYGNPECGVQVMRMDPHLDTGPHDHLFLEIALVERGEAQHQTAAGTAVVKAGQLMVIRPQVWHGYLHCRDMSVINCLISMGAIHQILPLMEEVAGVDELLRRRRRTVAEETPLVLTPARWVFGRARETLQAMLAEQDRREPAWQAANLGQLLQLLALVVRAVDAGKHEVRLPQRTAQAVRRAAGLVEARYRQEVSLPELAGAVGLSEAHLSRSFKRQIGMGLVDYCHHLRIEEACRLLRLTDWAVSRIAGQVGYAEIAYFSRCFRKRMGKSPSEYREAE